MAKKRRRNRKWLKRLLILLLVIGAGAVCYLVWDAYLKEESIPAPDNSGGTTVVEEIEVDEGYGEAEEGEVVVEEKEEIQQYEGGDPNKGSDLTGVVSYAAVLDGILRIRVNIDQFVTEGSCELSLVRDGKSIYNASALMTDAVSTATCEGFDVPVANLSTGKVQIVINLKAGSKTGVINGEVEL
ncbi:MAG: hypothetical protein Q4B29_01430 [Candidatus Saccharibacteria bacterium]|nr:hypothetical protein [Candidatus Saccharibacteria bacterium]